MALAIDVNVSADAHLGGNNTGSISSPSFSTASADEVLFAFITSGGGMNSSGGVTVTSVSGGSLTWTLAARANTKAGSSEIWSAVAASVLASVTVTANLQFTGSGGQGAASITIVSFTGADTTGAIGATNTAGGKSAPSLSLTTTRDGSWVWGCGDDWDNNTARTVGSGQTMVHQFVNATDGDTTWCQRQTNTTPSSGTSVTINDTAPTGDQYNLAIVEILAASGGPPPPVTSPQRMALLGCGA